MFEIIFSVTIIDVVLLSLSIKYESVKQYVFNISVFDICKKIAEIRYFFIASVKSSSPLVDITGHVTRVTCLVEHYGK